MHNYFVFGFSFSVSREIVPRILIAFATLRLFLTPEQKALKVVLISLMSYVFLSHSAWECKQIPVQYSLVHLFQHSASSDGPSDVCRNLTNRISLTECEVLTEWSPTYLEGTKPRMAWAVSIMGERIGLQYQN